MTYKKCIYCGNPTAEEISASIEGGIGLSKIVSLSTSLTRDLKYFSCSYCKSSYIVVCEGVEAEDYKYILNSLFIPDWMQNTYESLRDSFPVLPDILEEFIERFIPSYIIIPVKRGITRIPKKIKGRMLVVGRIGGISMGIYIKNKGSNNMLSNIRRMGYHE